MKTNTNGTEESEKGRKKKVKFIQIGEIFENK